MLLVGQSQKDHQGAVMLHDRVTLRLQQVLSSFFCGFLYLHSIGRVSNIEQSRALIQGFQPTLWQHIASHLVIKLLDHYPDDPYPFDVLNSAAQYILHPALTVTVMQPNVFPALTQPPSPIIPTIDMKPPLPPLVPELPAITPELVQIFADILRPHVKPTAPAFAPTANIASRKLNSPLCTEDVKATHIVYIEQELCEL